MDWDGIAENYTGAMLTIWTDGVENPLFGFLDGLPRSEIRRVIDLGCGHGTLLGRIRSRFPEAEMTGLDGSCGMIERARAIHPEIGFVRGDLSDLSAHAGRYDLVLTTNSLLPASRSAAHRQFAEATRTVRPGGYFAGVLPSGDTIEHLMNLSLRAYRDGGLPLDDARAEVDRHYRGRHAFDPAEGLYADDPHGAHRQKVYWPAEIRALLHENALTLARLEKVYYAWEACRQFGWGYFPTAERVWDWAFLARRDDPK